MRRRAFMKSAAGLGLMAPLSAAIGAAGAARRPNVLVFLADDLGYGDVACFGSDRVKTPHLDQMAAEGIRFTQFYAPAPSCSPTRTGMMTGRNPFRLGIHTYIHQNTGMHLRREEITVGTLLKQVGYDTCFSGKWGCNSVIASPDEPQPDEHGFDHWFATQNNAIPSHLNPNNFARNGQLLGELKGYSAALVADEAITWLKARAGSEKPFCLFVWFHEPHRVVATPEEFVAPYRERFGAEKPAAAKASQKETPTTPEYLGNISHIDHQVGRVLATLKDLGVDGDTLALFTSDNGPVAPGSSGGLNGAKGTLWEGGIREPGILRWPAAVRAGQVCREPVTGLDLLPTLCELAGAAPPSDRALDGESVAALIAGQPFERHKPLFWWRIAGDAALREGDWKLIADPESKARFATTVEFIAQAKPEKFRLYNLARDPGEKDDVAAQEPERVKAMAARLTALYLEMQAESPRWPETALPPTSRKGAVVKEKGKAKAL